MRTKTIFIFTMAIILLLFMFMTPAKVQSRNTFQFNLLEPTPSPKPAFLETVAKRSAKTLPLASILNSTEIITDVTPTDLALAMDIPQKDLVSASFYTSDPLAFGEGDSPLGYNFPIQGNKFSILSTGLAASADWPNDSGSLSYDLSGLHNTQGNDLVQFGVEMRVPAGVNCANFDFAFFSEEFPEFVGSQFNDTFTAEFGGTNLIISGTQVIAPLNFAYDILKNAISVNTISGIIAPTDTTYDGMTALRQAQTPVTAGETALLVFSIQDLGDSIYDSAIFLDNFRWTYDLKCGGGIVPPPSPQGNLILHMASSIPSGNPIQPAVTVLNQSSGPVIYTVNIQLRQGFGLLAERSQLFSFLVSGSQQYTFDFGVHDPSSYYIRSELFQGGELLETKVQAFSVGLDYLRLQDAANILSDAATQELDETENYATDAMTQAALSSTNETVDVFIDAILGFVVTGLSGVKDLVPIEVNKAADDLTGKAQDFALSIQLGDYSKIYAYHRGILDRNTFNDKRISVETSRKDLLSFAQQQGFTWNPLWQADVIRHEAEISDVNETYSAGGITVREDYQPPFVRWATMTDLMSQFNWFKDKILPAVEIISTVLLIVFVIVLIIIGIILLIPSGGTSTTLLMIAVVVGKVIAAIFTTLWNWLLLSQTAKFLLSTVVIMLLAFGVSFSAEVRVSPEIVNRHQSAIDDLKDKISGDITLIASPLQLSGNTQTNRLDVSLNLTDSKQSSYAQVQLFRADGRLMDIVDLGMVESNQILSTYWNLAPGNYWVIGSTTGQVDRQSRRIDFHLDNQPVKIELNVSNKTVSLGDAINAQVTLTNMDGSIPTGDLEVTLQSLSGNIFQIWTTNLAPGAKALFQYNFVPQNSGSFVLRASVGDLNQPLTSADQPILVGNGPAFGLQIDANENLPAGQPLTWEVTAINAGNQYGSIPVKLQVFDESGNPVGTAINDISLDPDMYSSFSLTPIPSVEPGKYRALLYLGDQLYTMRNLIVGADGALFAIVNTDPIQVGVMTPISITLDVQNELFQPTDSELKVDITVPDGSFSHLYMQRSDIGKYSAVYTPTITGTFSVEALVNKEHYLGSTSQTYFSAGYPGLLNSSIQNQIVVGVTQEITISVSNEYRIPVKDATLIISGTDILISGKTDGSGSAHFVIAPTSDETLSLLIRKAGYVETLASLPVEIIADTTPPLLTFSAQAITNQTPVEISGRSETGSIVTISGEIVPVNSSGEFTTTVTLLEGLNMIIAEAKDSALNTTILTKTVLLDTVPPVITISGPSTGMKTDKNTILVYGTAKDTSLLLVNDQPVEVKPDGSFSGWVILNHLGDNQLLINALDGAGNITKREITVIRTTNIYLPITVR